MRTVVAGWMVVLVAACSGGVAEPGPGRADPPGGSGPDGSVLLSFGQLSSHVGTNQGLLRVVNHGTTDLHVTGVGLDWPGYGDRFVRPEDRVIDPGGTVDFPVVLPDPECPDAPDQTAPPNRLLGVVEAGDATISKDLEESGEVLLRRVHAQACQERFVRERVEIEYGDTWTATDDSPESSILGHLAVTRRGGTEAVRLVGAEGSVLYDLELPGPAVLPTGVPGARLPLRIVPGNRCDEHARSQATAPFSFGFRVRIGDQTLEVPLIPPPDVQARITALLDRACG